MDRKRTSKEDQMMVIRYFKHIDFTVASNSTHMGFSLDIESFLRTVRIGKQQTVRKKNVSTQTTETRSISPSVFSKEFREMRN